MAVLKDGMALKQGTFIITSLLGRGGFGEVYLARQPRMNRDVAVKVLLPNQARDDSIVRRFEREALAAGSLIHPNILPVFDFDYDSTLDLYFLAMQYVPGGRTLQLHVGSPMEPTEICPILNAVGSALDSAHDLGIIHRDVKPANVLLYGTRPLLTDFGIAYLGAMAGITALGTAIGTPHYMSPEQATGKTVVPASDQYSLAIMAFELLTGRLPFLGDPISILMQQVQKPPPDIVGLNPTLPPRFSGVFARALAKPTGDRHSSCSAFAQALSEITAAEPPRLIVMSSDTLILGAGERTELNEIASDPAEPVDAPIPAAAPEGSSVEDMLPTIAEPPGDLTVKAESSPPNALVTIDIEGRIIALNDGAAELLGAASIEAIGRPYPEVLGPSLADRLLSLFLRVSRSHEPGVPRVVEATLPNGARATLEVTLDPFFDEGDHFAGIHMQIHRPESES